MFGASDISKEVAIKKITDIYLKTYDLDSTLDYARKNNLIDSFKAFLIKNNLIYNFIKNSNNTDKGYFDIKAILVRELLDEQYRLAISEYAKGNDISKYINNLDSFNKLKLIDYKPEILTKYSKLYRSDLLSINLETLIKYFDFNYLDNETIIPRLSEYPRLIVDNKDKFNNTLLVKIINNNIDGFIEYIDELNDEVLNELMPVLARNIIDNRTILKEEIFKRLITNEDFISKYLQIYPDYAKYLDASFKLATDVQLNIIRMIDTTNMVLPYPVYDLYKKYGIIESHIIYKHPELVNDLEAIEILTKNYSQIEVFEWLNKNGFVFDENTPEYLLDNQEIIKYILSNGIKCKNNIPFDKLPVKEVFDFFLNNYDISDINKYVIFNNNPLIIEWGATHGLPPEEIFNRLDISNFSKLDDNTLTIKSNKVTIDNINSIIHIITNSPNTKINKILIDLQFNSDGFKNNELLECTNISYLEYLESTGINFEFTTGDAKFTMHDVISSERFLETVSNELNNSGLSEFEKYIAAYDIVKNIHKYKEYGISDISRSLYSVLSSEYIVCAGFATLLNNILYRINIPSAKLGCSCRDNSRDGDHARNYVYINDPKYNIDGIYQCDSTWDNDSLYKYKHLLIRTNYAYSVDLKDDSPYVREDDIFNISRGNINSNLEIIKKLDTKLYTKYKNKEITDKEFIEKVKSKLDNKVDVSTILSAIRTVKAKIYKDDIMVDNYMNNVISYLMPNDFLTLEEKRNLTKEVYEYRKNNSILNDDTTYAEAYNSPLFIDINNYISRLNGELKKYKCDYNYDKSQIEGAVEKDNIERINYLSDKGTLEDYDDEYIFFTIPYELNPDLNVKEQAEEIGKLINNLSNEYKR